MLRKRILSIFNPFGHRLRCSTVERDPTEEREKWRIPVLDQLVSDYGNEKLIQKLFIENPQYEKSDPNVWKNFMRTLSVNGFEYRESFKILQQCPDALGYPTEQMDRAVNQWRSIFISDMLKFLILNHPDFLILDEKCIMKRGQSLLSYCQSNEPLLKMLVLCPNLMYEDFNEILKKMDFLEKEMVVYRMEIFHCKALSKSLRHIKLRFSILEKCGVYTRPNPYFHKQTIKEKMKLNNPVLKDITDRSDTSFARKIANISREEYETYAELFDKYEYEHSDSDSDSDSSSESDSDET